MQCPCITQNGKHGVGDRGGIVLFGCRETARHVELAADKQDVTQHRKQICLQGTDDAAINERLFRWIDQFQFDAALTAQHVDVKILKAGEQFVAAVSLAAGVEYCQRAIAKQLVEVAAGCALEHIDFQLREQIH